VLGKICTATAAVVAGQVRDVRCGCCAWAAEYVFLAGSSGTRWQ
jgi:hypothetical protein